MTGVRLTSASRMSDDDWPGVLVKVSDGWRVVVNNAGTRYALQERGQLPDGCTVWGGASYRTISALIEKGAAKAEGLAVACEALPDDPAQAAPGLTSAQAAIVDAFRQNDWRQAAYAGVIAQDENIRVVICPDGAEYRLQTVTREQYARGHDDGAWITQAKSVRACDLGDYCTRFGLRFGETGPRHYTQKERVLRLLKDIPRVASGNPPLALPARPAVLPRDE